MKRVKRLLSVCLIVATMLVTPVFAKAPTTTYKGIIKGDMNGVATEVEVTIYDYLGELTVDFPVISYNEDYTETSVEIEKKTLHVARYRERKPQVEFRMTKGSDSIVQASSYPGCLVYGYGDIYIPEGTDTTDFLKGFYGQGQIGEGFGTKELATMTYFGSAVVPIVMNYYTKDYEAFGYVMMDDLLIITEEEEANFLKTGALSEWDTFAWPGLKELLTSDKTQVVPEAKAEKIKATKAYTKVQVDDVEKGFDAYIINNSNYFKLRDFAYAIQGSDKGFSVGWDEAKKAITLTSKTAYKPIGTELEITEQKGNINVVKSASTLYVDGQQVALEAYVIDGNTYFKLRDMAELFNIETRFDAATQQVSIHTF